MRATRPSETRLVRSAPIDDAVPPSITGAARPPHLDGLHTYEAAAAALRAVAPLSDRPVVPRGARDTHGRGDFGVHRWGLLRSEYPRSVAAATSACWASLGRPGHRSESASRRRPGAAPGRGRAAYARREAANRFSQYELTEAHGLVWSPSQRASPDVRPARPGVATALRPGSSFLAKLSTRQSVEPSRD
jgi:hypothetical protein